MKFTGAMLILAAGYLLSRRLIEPAIRHMKLLEEGEFLFRLMESEIRNAKIPLPELFLDISGRTESVWKNFFRDLSEELKKNGDVVFADEFERLMTFHLSETLSEDELLLFFQVGRNLLSDDFLFHQHSAAQLSDRIRNHASQMRERLNNQKKVYQALCLFMSALIVIVLL